MVWVPGHAGLTLNERADEAARRGTLLPQPATNPSFHAMAGRIKRNIEPAWKRHYMAEVPPDNLHRRISEGEALPLDKARSREADVALYQLRANRAPFLQDTKHRWGRADTPQCPHCGAQQEDTTHFILECPRWAAARAALLGNPTIEVLQTDGRGVCNFLRETGVLAHPPYVI